jgi:predicted dinucleotide-binding enzyme
MKEMVCSYARSNDKLKELAEDAKGDAPGEAAKEADALLLAVHWSRIDDVPKQAGDLSGKVIVTCCLPMDSGDTKLIVGTITSGAEELAKKAPKNRVVCAFNTVPSEVLFGVFEARSKKPRPSLVCSGDDQSAKDVVAKLIDDAGFDAVGVGPHGSPGTPSRLRCSSPKSPTTGKFTRLIVLAYLSTHATAICRSS